MAEARKGFDPLASLFDAPDAFRAPTTSPIGSFEDDDTSPTLHPDVAGGDFEVEEPSLVEPRIDKVALARALARAAMARMANEVTEAPPPPPPAASAPLASREPETEEVSDPSLRLLARAKRPTSALDALQQAKQREEKARVRARQRRISQLPDDVRRVLKRQCPGAQLEVVNALVMDERSMLRALWKGHRSRLSAQGALHQVVATTNVIRALTAVGPGQLVAAIVRTASSEYLVWVDMGSQSTVAAFEDARTWIAG